jgi:hypothetical protein
VYVALVARRAGRARYRPVMEDWIWHVVLPFAAYGLQLGGSALLLALVSWRTYALFLIAGAALLLLFAGIHNAWDTVTYVVTSDDRT